MGRYLDLLSGLVDQGEIVVGDYKGKTMLPRPDDSSEIVWSALPIAEALRQRSTMVER